MKLKDQPEVQELLAKAADKAAAEKDKAIKAEAKRILSLVKDAGKTSVETLKTETNKAGAKAVADFVKQVAEQLKAA